MGLDLEWNDGKFVSIPYLQTDGWRDKKKDRGTQRYMGLVDFKNHVKAYNPNNFCLTDTKTTF